MHIRFLLRGLVALFLLAGLVIGTSAWKVSQATEARAERCAKNSNDAARRAATDTGVESVAGRITVIGDSYSVGLGQADLATSWPSMLPGRVHVEGFSGSGFSEHASACGAVWYAARAPRAVASRPDVVVVEGGLNDFDQADADIEAGAEDVLDALAGVDVVLVGPPPAPSRAGEVPRVDAVLARVAAERGVPYVSAAGWDDLAYLPDRLHLTAEGHRVFGDRVATALLRIQAGVPLGS